MKDALLSLLASVNIADKAAIYQHYDTEVQARAVIRPGEADAAVEIFVPGQPFALAVAVRRSLAHRPAGPLRGRRVVGVRGHAQRGLRGRASAGGHRLPQLR